MSDTPRASTTLQAYGLAAIGGVTYFLGFAGFGIWPLALVALVPLWAALEMPSHRWARRALGVGWLYGIVTCAGGYHWLIPMLKVFSGYGTVPSAAFWFIFSSFLGGQFAAYALMYQALRRRGWIVLAAAIPPLVVAEWLYPLLFPTYLANSFYEQTALVQVADLGGPLLVTMVAAWVNVAFFETWRALRGARAPTFRLWAATLLLLAVTLTYGVWRIREITAELEFAPTLEVGVVQVNMGIFEKRREVEEGHQRHIEQTQELEREGGLDLVIWPESAYVKRLPRAVPFSAARVRRDLRLPILFGGVSEEQVGLQREIYNTAFLIDKDGEVRSSYDKTFLLAFGEYLPFGSTFPILYDLSPNSGRFSRGTHLRPLLFGPWRISTPICYEDVLPDFTREMVRVARPHLLVNLTNDSWFGNTQEPWIHLALSRFRAIEHRRYLVRATNSGVSAIIDPLGQVVVESGLMTRENLRGQVRMLQYETWYERLGDWPGWVSLILVLGMLIARRRVAR